ncbi:MAG: glycosyltransferase, partial [Clostridia bacterium]
GCQVHYEGQKIFRGSRYTRLAASCPEGRVRLTGRLSRPALRALYQTSTVLAFPSLYEGFGLPPAQAQAAGLPVVAAHGPALHEVLGEGALFVDPRNVAEWQERLHDILSNAALRTELVEAGRLQAARFRWETLVPRYRELYREVLGA